MVVLAGLLFVTAAIGAQPSEPDGRAISVHELAVKQFASTLAVADVASKRCVDILIDMRMLDDLRDRLGMSVADKLALAKETADVQSVLNKAIAEASSTQAWCDSVYRLYGPDGSLIRGFVIRSRSDRSGNIGLSP